MSLFNELKRRNVFKVGIAYLIVAWLIVQVADVMIDNIGAPDWLFQAIVLVLALGFPLVLLFAWAFELTPEGLKREKDVDRSQSIAPQTGQKLNYAIMAVMALALGYFAWDKFSDGGTALQGDTAREFVIDKSIAVLPFVNMSADADNEYFSDGLSEELLNLLAKVDGLKVAARTSSFKFKESEDDIADIGQKLNVATILEGSVRKAGQQVRITAQLIKVDDGFHLWSETYDRSLDNIFEVQDEIARAIVDALKLPLLGHDDAPVTAQASSSFEAYDLYLLGQHRLSQINEEGFQAAADYFTRAVAMDPGYAPAWSGMARAYMGLADYGGMATPEAYSLAEKAIEKASTLAPDAPATLVAKARLLAYRGRPHEAIPLLERAVQSEPNNVYALNSLAEALWADDPGRALDYAKKAWALDPLAETTRSALIGTTWQAGDREGAVRLAREMILEDPDNPGLHEVLGVLYFQAGKHDLAIPSLELTWKLRPGDVYPAAMIVRAYLSLGDAEAAAEWEAKARGRGPDSRWLNIIELVTFFHNREWESMASRYAEMQAANNLIPQGRLFHGDALLRQGKAEQAEQLYRSVSDEFGGAAEPVANELHANASRRLLFVIPDGAEKSQRVEALERYGQSLVDRDPMNMDTWTLQAQLAAADKDPQRMYAAIERAIENGALYRRGWEANPAYERYRDDPQFRSLLAEMDQKAAGQLERLRARQAPGP